VRGSGRLGSSVSELRRLTNAELSNTLRDLFGAEAHAAIASEVAFLPAEAKAIRSSTRISDFLGLLTRAALLAGAEEETQPFERAERVMAQVLCRPAPRPDPTKLPEGALATPPLDPNMSTRERFESKTSPPDCIGCQAKLNPIGAPTLVPTSATGTGSGRPVTSDRSPGPVTGIRPRTGSSERGTGTGTGWWLGSDRTSAGRH
jgi:hypothetical protein